MGFSDAMAFEVRRRALRILILLWLGWYTSGPLCETIDFWDTPQEEMRDVMCSAGGAATLVAGIFCLGILLFRKWRERYSFSTRIVRDSLPPLTFDLPILAVSSSPASSHSPPLSPLRI